MSRVSEEQLRTLSRMLQPVIARCLEEPVEDTTVEITCTPVDAEEPDGASIMSFQVRVRGVDATLEQEERISQLLRTHAAASGTLVKTKRVPV